MCAAFTTLDSFLKPLICYFLIKPMGKTSYKYMEASFKSLFFQH